MFKESIIFGFKYFVLGLGVDMSFFRLCGVMLLAIFTLNACSGEGASGNEDQDGSRQGESGKNQDSSGYGSLDENQCPVITSRDQLLNPDVNYGEFVDPRDGHSYKTVKIGKQTWFAQNLNYESERSLCIDTLGNNCEIYGRRYVGDYCPEGWHLPSMSEWSELLSAAGRNDEIEAVMLKSRFGWKDSERGIDTLGFSMSPFSSRNCVQTSFLIGGKYSNNDYSVNCVTFGQLVHGYYTDDASYVTGCSVGYFYNVSEGLPVRCVKDEENEVPGPTIDTENLGFWNNESKEDFLNPGIEYGEMTDERDGKTYKTVQIGEQTWMAENLDYVYKVDTLVEEEGSCLYLFNKYDFDADRIRSCDVFGRLYPYGAAMDSAAVFSDDGKACRILKCVPNKQVRGICPEGWRLPKDEDWDALFETVGGADVAGKKLKSLVGWNFNGNGTDDYGFSVVPSGTDAGIMHYHTGFWSAGPDRFGVYFSFYNDAVYSGRSDQMHIRCVKGYTHVDDPSRYIPGIDTSTVVHGTMTDERDGQTYKTVKIGEQVWMAENLNYNYQVSDTLSIYGSVSRADVSDSGADYGRYYTWPAAVDAAGIFSDGGKGCSFNEECNPTGIIRGVCPAGWHLPDSTEWNTLFSALNCVDGYSKNCASLLKSVHGWLGRGGGYDYYGFTVMPADLAEWGGSLAYGWKFDEIRAGGTHAYFWTSMESTDYEAVHVSIGTYESVSASRTRKTYGMSVRCLKD